MYFATTKAHKVYSDVSYSPDCYLMFGKESAGIPEEILVENEEHCIRIPMWGDIRSLNLSNSAAIVLYEALRQNGFERWSWRESCIIFPGIARSNIYKFTFSVRNLIICDKIPPIL